jgi:RHS repeat-associated protein
MLNERLLAAGCSETVTVKRADSENPSERTVTQEDLNALRSKVIWLEANFYVATNQFQLEQGPASAAFPFLLGNPIDAIFTKVPGKYRENGTDLFENDFTNVPPLWVHFTELSEHIQAMTTTLRDGAWSSEGDLNMKMSGLVTSLDEWETEEERFLLYSTAALSRYAAYEPIETPVDIWRWCLVQPLTAAGSDGPLAISCFFADAPAAYIYRCYAYYVVENLGVSIPHRVSFYNYYTADTNEYSSFPTDFFGDAHLQANHWTRWSWTEANNFDRVVSDKLGSSDLSFHELDDLSDWPFSGNERGYVFGPEGGGVVQAIVQWDFPQPPSLQNPALDDPEEDGLVGNGCECTDCGFANTKIDWRNDRAAAQGQFQLGESGGSQNIRIRAYVTDYKISGVPHQMFSLDTAVIDHTGNEGEGWEFATVRRPSGAEVVFSLKGANPGHPERIARHYKMVKSGDSLEVRFPMSDVVHRFGVEGNLEQVSDIRSGASVTGSTNEWPMMRMYRNGSAILSNVCSRFTAVPVYSGSLIVSVDYFARNAKQQRESILPGSRIFRALDATDTVKNETRIVTTNGAEEIWRGVRTNASVITVALKETRREVVDASTGLLTVYETRVLNPGATDEQSNITQRLIQHFPWGDETISETAGYGGPFPQTTRYTYYANAVETNTYGRLKLMDSPDGAWSRHEYDNAGRGTAVYTPFCSVGPDAEAHSCRVSRFFFVGDSILATLSFPAEDVGTDPDERPRLEVEEVLGQEVSRTYHAYLPGRQVTKQCRSAGAAYNATDSLVTTAYVITNGPFQGRTWKVEHPNGTINLIDYEMEEVSERLITTTRVGVGSGSTVTDGRETVVVRDAGKQTLSVVTRDIASGFILSDIEYARDAFGRVTCESNTVSVSFSTTDFGCCGPSSRLDSDGILTEWDYTDLKQVFAETRLGVTRYFNYDVSGNVVESRVSTTGMADRVTYAVYDEAGRLVAETNELGYTTLHTYSTNSLGERQETLTYPDETTITTTYYRDGQLKARSGNASTPQFCAYGVDANGAFTIEYAGPDDQGPAWVKTYVNLLGQAWKTVYPNGYAVVTTYDSAGRPVKQSDGSTTTLTAYNDNGEAFRSAVDMNDNAEIDLAGSDRISETLSGYVLFESKPVRETVSRTYPTNNNAEAQVLSVSRSALDGSTSWSIAFGRTNRSDVTRNPATASRVETITAPDGTQNVSFYTNGLLKTAQRKSGSGTILSTTTYAHDSFGRLSQIRQPAANGQTLGTTFDFDAAGNVVTTLVSVGSFAQQTVQVFDSMGRRVRTVLPDGGEVVYEYTPSGQLASQNGAQTYPITCTYDAQGRMASLSTYRNGPGGSADTTTWTYDAQRGWLTAKGLADSTSVQFSYTDDGKVSRRTWARGVTTDYAFDPAGSLTNIDYSDSTPDVSYTMDRLGRVVEIVDGLGTHTNIFTADGSLAFMSLPQMPELSLAYRTDALGRRIELVLTNAASSASVYAVGYDFDDAGRLEAVRHPGGTATYSYGPDGTTWTNLSFGEALNTRRTFDGLNRLSSIANSSPAGTVYAASYSLNQANQRITNSLVDGGKWVYQYNERGEVVSGKKYFSDGQPVQGAQFEYIFDTIGNRISAKGGSTSSSAAAYTANNANQYTQREAPGVVELTGEATVDANVSVQLEMNNATPANRHGEFFWKAVGVANSSSAFCTTNLKVTATIANGTQSLVRTEIKTVFLPKTPEAFTWDSDGNLVSDGRWTNTWDANNRMVSAESRSAVPDTMKKRLTFRYDSMGRRTVKKVESGRSGGVYGVTNITTYVWDGWNIIAEFRSDHSVVNASTNFYSWGLDLSGSLGGAGGVGGLVSVCVNGTNAIPFYNGNGDVMGLVSSAGTIFAEYEYSPVGGMLKTVGPLAKVNPLRFSTKLTDDETGVVCFQLRDYRPDLARFTSMDPLEEDAGPNPYSLLGNQPISQVDDLGLALYAFDGTWNDREKMKRPTNVAKLVDSYKGNKWYEKGVGTDWGTKFIGGGTGAGGGNRIARMYKKLIEYYGKPDPTGENQEIDVIGFSRGAALARTFVNYINSKGGVQMMGADGKLSADVCPVKIRFLGVFDTVASFGLPGNDVNWGQRLAIPVNVENIRHAVALDEKRGMFPLSSALSNPNAPFADPRIVEVGFRGAHSDIGGGYEDGDRSNFALMWMRNEGVSVGVPFGPLAPEDIGASNPIIHDERSSRERRRNRPRVIYYPNDGR